MASPDTVRLPLTAAQEGVWIGQQLDPTSSMYNAAECVEIDGPLDTALFERALRTAVAEADAVHVRFAEDADGGAVQELRAPEDWALPIVAVADRSAAQAWMDDDLRRLADLERGPLFAHALLALRGGGFLWFHRAHHIALDGYGFSLIAGRVAAIYTALAGGGASTGRPFGRLRAVVDDDRAYQRSPRRDDDREFWHARFADRPAVASMSERAAVPCGYTLRHGDELPPGAMDRWRAVADESATTWAHVVLALVATYVQRQTGAAEVILGVPVMGRLGSPAARTPAMLVNIVPLRVPVAEGAPLPDVVRAVTRELDLVRPHQRYRGEHLRRELGLVGGGRRLHGPVVNVMPFDYSLRFGPHRAVARNLSAGAQFVEDMVVQLHARFDGQPLRIDIDANPAAYSPADLAVHMRGLLDLLADPCGRSLAGAVA